jgi:cation:H+ antiporter
MTPSGSAGSLAGLAPWQARVAAALGCTLPGFMLRISGGGASPPVQFVLYGIAVVAAAFMLAWACEAAQVDFSSGIVVSAVAFVAILPEFIVELHFAFSGRADYVTANLTGASRLVLSFCVSMPAAVAFLPARFRPARLNSITLDPGNRLELAVLGLAALWATRGVLTGHLTLLDSVVLVGLYVFYLRRAAGGGAEAPPPGGVAAELAKLPKPERRRWVGSLLAFSAFQILLTAVPFGDAVLKTGAIVGLSPYVVLQWFVPVATEMPELVVAFVLLTHRRGTQALAVLLAGAVSQYTLALGVLPLAYDAGAGSGPLPLRGTERIELFLTAGVALFAVAALITRRLSRADASLMLILFGTQFVLAVGPARLVIGIVFWALAVDILVSERRRVRSLWRTLRPRPAGPAA